MNSILKIVSVLALNLALLSSASFADSYFMDQLNGQITTEEEASILNASIEKRIEVSYKVYLKGYVSSNDLLDYWERLFIVSTSEKDQSSIKVAIHGVIEANFLSVAQLSN